MCIDALTINIAKALCNAAPIAAVLSTCMSSSAYCNKPNRANKLVCLRIRETACMYCAVAEITMTVAHAS